LVPIDKEIGGACAVNRSELQQLAEDRLLDAQALLAAGRWSAAYYLAGYAVECGLKACILAYIERTGVIFTDRKFADRCWTHSVEELVRLADLEVARGIDVSANPALGRNWLIVKDWTELSRYQVTPQNQAQQLLGAIGDPTDGVLPWIRSRW
jgi:HEPN domain-containing protein